jgi:hypothetical protein
LFSHPGSIAIGAGTTIAGVSTDQRGEPLGSPPDIGAYQSGPTNPPAHPPTFPTVVGIDSVEHVKKRIAAIDISFSQAIDPSSLQRYLSYGLVPVVKNRRPIPDGRNVRSASFAPAPNVLHLVLWKPYRGRLRVQISGEAEALDGLLGGVSFTQVVQ